MFGGMGLLNHNSLGRSTSSRGRTSTGACSRHNSLRDRLADRIHCLDDCSSGSSTRGTRSSSLLRRFVLGDFLRALVLFFELTFFLLEFMAQVDKYRKNKGPAGANQDDGNCDSDGSQADHDGISSIEISLDYDDDAINGTPTSDDA